MSSPTQNSASGVPVAEYTTALGAQRPSDLLRMVRPLTRRNRESGSSAKWLGRPSMFSTVVRRSCCPVTVTSSPVKVPFGLHPTHPLM